MTQARVLFIMLLVASLAIPVLGERTRLKPDFNIFTVAQDVELGRRVSKEMEAQTEILADPIADNFLNALGKRLVSKAPGGEQYRLQLKIMNDRSINAVGLPGGFLYVNRGTIEAATTEAQLALVIAHEIGHIVLRHGTHQISKAYVLQTPVSTLGRIGRTSVSEVLGKIGGGFTATSVVLKNPIEAENQADLIAIQVVYDAGYDPHAAVQIFEKLAVESTARESSVRDHPAPSSRVANIKKELAAFGDVRPDGILDSPDYQHTRLLVSTAPASR